MAAPWNILVVDDEPDLEPLILQRMRRHIRKGLYTFQFAHNGLEALEVLRNDTNIDLVLSDINMPQMDGLTLLSELPGVSPDVRAVVVSAYGDMDNIRTAMNRGAFDFVTKPIDFNDLTITIDRTADNLRQWREAQQSRDKLMALQSELDIASGVQQSILSDAFPDSDEYSVYAHMVPARNVGGDFYDFLELPNGRLSVTVADVSDKGIPAALFMMSSRTSMKGAVIGGSTPPEALAEVNQVLQADNPSAMFVTVITAEYDPGSGQCSYSCGGHDPPVLFRADGSSEQLASSMGIALGIAPGLTYQEKSVTLQPGESLVLYTDGVSEAMNLDQEEFGLHRLLSTFPSGTPQSAREVVEGVFDAVNAFAGEAPASDDTTCLVIRRSEDS